MRNWKSLIQLDEHDQQGGTSLFAIDSATTLEERIRQYLTENVLYVEDGFEYSNDTSFIRQGLLDSTGVMSLVSFVESAFSIKVDTKEVTLQNFDSVNNLVSFIRGKLVSQTQADD
jgi:acyl carrier protein